MPNIAIAGGTSPTLGTAIVNALLASSANHLITILSSRPARDDHLPPSVSIRTVNYDDISNLYYALSDVDILISVLKVPGPEWVTYQLNLLRAAIAAGVKRFSPSEFELGPVADGDVDILAGKLAVWDACRTAMEKREIICARFSCGMFMNYLGLGSRRGVGATHGLEDAPIIWDVGNMAVELPLANYAGGGKGAILTMTEIGDVGRFVAAACELPLDAWPETGDFGMVGETVQVEEVARVIERVRERELAVVSWADKAEYQRRADDIEGFGTNSQEIRGKMVAQILSVTCDGKAVVNSRLNELCPWVRPTRVEEYLRGVWGEGGRHISDI